MTGKIGRKRRLVGLVAVCLAAVCLLGGCGDDGTGKGFRFPLEAEPAQLDPQVSADTASLTVLSALFEGLTQLDEDGNALPGAAEWTVSEDGRVYTFTLRESYWSTVKVCGQETPWDEPTPVTADDFVFGMQRAVSPQTGCPLAGELRGIRNAAAILEGKKDASALGVKALDETHLQITLTAPDADFPVKLASPPFMPCNREFFTYTGGRYGIEKVYVLTNGAFALTAWNKGDSLLLHKNEFYHAAQAVCPQAVRFVLNTEDPVAQLRGGTLDAAPLTAAQAQTLTDAGMTPVILQDQVRGVLLNTRDAVLCEANVRRALRDAVEWSAIYTYLEQAGETVATGYVAPDARGDRTAVTRFSTAVGAAQTSLGKGLAALYPKEKAPALPTLTVLAADDEHSANLARYLVQSWQKNLKLYCTMTLISESRLAARVRSGDYQVAIAAHPASGLTAAENLHAFATGAAENVTGFSSAALDAALKKSDVPAVEGILRQECPLLPLTFPRRYYGVAANTQDIEVRPFGGGAAGATVGFLQAKKWDK